MADSRGNGGWNKFLVGCLWAVAVSFASLCVAGFFHLEKKVEAAQEKIARFDECISTMKQDIRDIKDMVFAIYKQGR